MEALLKEAVEIVKAQAGHRLMTAEEMISMIKSLSVSLQAVEAGELVIESSAVAAIDPKKAIKEKSVTCIECGKSFKVLTKKHLAQHGLTPDEYRAKHGMKKGTALIAKGLARDRRNKMKDMRLWEKRGSAKKTAE